MKTRKIKNGAADNRPIVAICYDFDKTLSPMDMQNFGLIPKLKCDLKEFWAKADKLAKLNGMDKILAYMRLIIEEAQAKKTRLCRADFKKLGKDIQLFNGVKEWFENIEKVADGIGVAVEHYVISAGLKEIIDGTSIRDKFTEVYASGFLYDEYGAPCWPSQVVNYTSKTQYIFRISKGCLDITDDDGVNNYVSEERRRIPLKRFIYIGDSATDVPAMKIVKQAGGTSIGVYNPSEIENGKVKKLLKDGRIDYLMPADYSADGKLFELVCAVITHLKSDYDLETLESKSEKSAKDR